MVYVPVEGEIESFAYDGSGGIDLQRAVGAKLGIGESARGRLASTFCSLGYWIQVLQRRDAEAQGLPENPRATQLQRCWRVCGPAVLFNERCVDAVDLSCEEVHQLLALRDAVIPSETDGLDHVAALAATLAVDHESIADQRHSLLARAQRLSSTGGPVRECMYCQRQGHWRRCSRCHGPYYCSTHCQTEHWKIGHKAGCGQGLFYDQ